MDLVIILLILIGILALIALTWWVSNSTTAATGATGNVIAGYFYPGTNYPGNFEYPGVNSALEYGINDSGATNLRLDSYIFNSDEELATLIADFEKKYSNQNRIIVCGFTTDQLLIGADTLNKLGSNTVLLSLDSSAPITEDRPNLVSMMYSDNVSATTVLMYAKLARNDRLIIIYDMDSLYAVSYKDLLLAKGTSFGFNDIVTLDFEGNNPQSLQTMATNLLQIVDINDIIVYIGDTQDFYNISIYGNFDQDSPNPFPPGVRFVGTDTCSDLQNKFSPGLDICINIPYSSDYTETTRRLYQHLLENDPNPASFYSFIAPFAYDCGYKLGLLSTVNPPMNQYRQYFIGVNPPIPAALSTISIDSKTGRPQYGNYVFCYTSGSNLTPDAVTFRKELIGAIQTLPNGTDIPFRMGRYSWTGITEYAILVNQWEDVVLNGTSITHLMSVQSLELSSNNKIGYNEFVYSVADYNNQINVPDGIDLHLAPTTLNYF